MVSVLHELSVLVLAERGGAKFQVSLSQDNEERDAVNIHNAYIIKQHCTLSI